MTDFERKILRHLNGEDVPGLTWGAAMGVAIEWLEDNGYIRNNSGDYEITDTGRAALVGD